jgi:hypothetical protein
MDSTVPAPKAVRPFLRDHERSQPPSLTCITGLNSLNSFALSQRIPRWHGNGVRSSRGRSPARGWSERQNPATDEE